MPILHLSGIDFHIFVGGGERELENIGFLVHCLLWQLVGVGNKSNGMCLSNEAVLCMTL